ncbi:MAG: hypothetical protein CW335_05380, partial [Clostridiales bacterium]|nr:hypothetical protein [Clostridiales bacterium]
MNKNKMRRLLQPSMVAYFVVMALFCVAALILKQFYLAAGEAVVLLLLLAGYRWANARRRRALNEYVQTTNEMMRKSADSEVPFPVALIQLNEDELVWYNKSFAKLTDVRDTLSAQNIADILPGFSTQWLTSGKTTCPDELRYRGRRFRVTGSILPSKDAK